MSTFPDGVFQYGGQPVGGAYFSSPWATAWFVDGTNGNDNNSGLKPTEAFDTVQAAVTKAGRGDIIYIRPLTYTTDASDVNRYIEAITVPYATADLSLIGVSNTNPGNPNYGAKLQYTATSGTCLTVNAPACHLENICVRAEGATNGVYFYGVGTGDDYATYAGSCGPTMNNVVVRGGTYGVQAVSGYAGYIANCRFEGGTSQSSSIYLDGNASPMRRYVVRDCHFDSFNGAAIDNAYIRIRSNTDLLVYRCTFDIKPTDGYYINATGTNLGLIAHCWFGEADLDTDNEIIQGGLMVVDCMDVAGHAATT